MEKWLEFGADWKTTITEMFFLWITTVIIQTSVGIQLLKMCSRGKKPHQSAFLVFLLLNGYVVSHELGF